MIPGTKIPKPCPGCERNERSATVVFCRECWRAVPVKLKRLFQQKERRREGIRAIIDHLRRERQEPRLL